jgi:hypothetical protein
VFSNTAQNLAKNVTVFATISQRCDKSMTTVDWALHLPARHFVPVLEKYQWQQGDNRLSECG